MSVNNDQIFSTDGIAATLASLPKALLMSDEAIAYEERKLAEQTETLEMAEVNASLNAICDGKDAATRELQRKQTVSKDPEVRAANSIMLETKASIETMKAQNKQLARQFAAYCHIAELRAAQMNLMSKGATK